MGLAGPYRWEAARRPALTTDFPLSVLARSDGVHPPSFELMQSVLRVDLAASSLVATRVHRRSGHFSEVESRGLFAATAPVAAIAFAVRTIQGRMSPMNVLPCEQRRVEGWAPCDGAGDRARAYAARALRPSNNGGAGRQIRCGR